MVKNGTTSAGRTRYRCLRCGCSTTRNRDDITRKHQLERFHTWVLSTNTQGTTNTARRQFRRDSAWCWKVPVAQPVVTGQIYPAVMIDGTYLQGWCLLIAYNTDHVVGWQWCHRENTVAYNQLLHRLTPAQMLVIDGAGCAAVAAAHTWPHVPIQRCYFHLYQRIRRHLSTQPRLEAGQQLLGLTRALMRVQDLDAAAVWLGAYGSWEGRWDQFLRHRTYAGSHRPRPTGIAPSARWWYTHRALPSARGTFRAVIKANTLFTWLHQDLPAQSPRTTSPLEGAVNSQIKHLLRYHRGLSEAHARTAVQWLLNSLTEHPHHPWDLARPEHWNPPRTIHHLREERIGPALYDQTFSWEDGNGIQHGWGGRSHR